MQSKSAKQEEDGAARHCAYCLKLCGLFPYKLCGGCKKRAYCSSECQDKDWSVNGNGQRHINWCQRHECGEEDVDWEVVPIPKKGLGIRAKKLLPAGFKIIVEPVFFTTKDHPGIKNLGPVGATLKKKFHLNAFMGGSLDGWKTVALRIARMNHSCQPNAYFTYDETVLVAVLFAQKDILPGEEVTSCYYSQLFRLSSTILTPFVNPEWSIEKELIFAKNELYEFPTKGIICPVDCPCLDPAIPALIKEGRQLHASVLTLAGQLKIEEALAVGEKLLNIHRRLNISWVYLGITMLDLFEIAVRKSEFLPRAKEYLRSAAELFGKICPHSEKYTKKVEMLLEHPETHPNYMLIDRMQNRQSDDI